MSWSAFTTQYTPSPLPGDRISLSCQTESSLYQVTTLEPTSYRLAMHMFFGSQADVSTLIKDLQKDLLLKVTGTFDEG